MNIQDIKSQIVKANHAYRIGSPIISDEEYDSLIEELEAELDFIEFASFKQTLTESKGTVANSYVLGSLTKIKYEDFEELYKWIKEHNIKRLFVSDKIDGCSFYAEYRGGKLTLLSSRGDGAEGTDWTDKAPYINIPQTIDYSGDLDIRGEVTLHQNGVDALGFKNKRNGTSGVMNTKDLEPNRLKYIHAYAYEVLSGELSIAAQFSLLEKLGFHTAHYLVWNTHERAMTILDHVSPVLHEDLAQNYKLHRFAMPYAMDGMVLSDYDYTPENEFFPKGKIAFKINSTGVPTTVKGIEWNLSKGGLLKPVVLIEPLEIDGTTVQRATGNNYQYLLDHGIATGATVYIIKSGEIIPKIVKVENKGVAVAPANCPSCDAILSVVGVDLKCTNKDCGEMLVKSLASFLIKAGVEGVTATSLENWNVRTFADLLNFVPEFGSKAQANFMKEVLVHVFTKTQEDLFACMTFDGAGETNINKIIEFYGAGDLIKATKAIYQYPRIELTEFPAGIGQKVIDKIYTDWKKNIYNVRAIMADIRWKPVAKAVVATGSALAGKSFCITGTLSKPRKEFEKMVTDNGGTLSSVSKKLSFLLVGADAGSKEDKAKELGVKILTEDEFMGMI